MPKISDEIVSFFTADVSGLESADRKQEAMARRATAREREINRELQRSADSRKRFGETVTSSITNPTAGAGRATDFLMGKIKGLGPAGIAVAVSLAAAGKVLRDIKRDAEASAERIAGLNEEFRKTTNANTFASAGEGTAGLVSRLGESEELRRKGREANEARDPYGYGTSFGGRASTAITKMVQPLVNFANDPLGTDREEREKLQMDLATKTALSQERDIRRKISAGIRADVSMIRDRVSGDRADAEILGLQLAKTKALADAKQASKFISPADQGRIAEGFDLQIKAAREQQAADQKRFFLSSATLGVQSSTLTQVQKQVKTQQLVIAAAKEELAGREAITAERRRELQLTILGAEGELKNERREKMFGKTEGQIQREVREEKKTRRELNKFDKRTDRDDGLIDLRKGMNGEITSGLDPLTGERRKPGPNYRPPPTGLETTGLETGTTRTMDDRTPSPFDDLPSGRDPAKRLMNPGASGFGDPGSRLSDPAGSGFGDPGERLRNMRAGQPSAANFRPEPRMSFGNSAANAIRSQQVKLLNDHSGYLRTIAQHMEKLGLS